jgi:long-subunit fatty acid transport protein
MIRRIAILVMIVCTISAVSAQNPNVGTSGAQFLKIPIGARATGMGGAFVGITDDVSSVFWNPAGLVHVRNYQAHFSYMNWLEMFDVNAFAVSYHAGRTGVFALSVLSLTMDKMEITTETQPNGTGLYFDARDIAIGLSYARFLTDRFGVGLTAKYVYQQIWNETGTGIAFDIGTQYRIDFNNLTIAMSMTNFGSELRFDGPDLNVTHDKNRDFPTSRLTPARLQTDRYPLPLHFQVGIGIDLLRTEFVKARGAVDVTHPNDNFERVHTGLEITVYDRIFLRGGYRYNYDDEQLAFGAGANIPVGGSVISFDYAYSIFDILPDVHRISVTLDF